MENEERLLECFNEIKRTSDYYCYLTTKNEIIVHTNEKENLGLIEKNYIQPITKMYRLRYSVKNNVFIIYI